MKKICTFSLAKILIRTMIFGIVASISHFIYELSGKSLIVGLFNPVNESVWEHLKFMFFPLLIWWIAMYLIHHKKCEISLNCWIVSAAVSLVTAPISVLFLFYFYTGALGIHSVFMDISLVFICYFLALSIAAHLQKHSKPGRGIAIVSVIVILIIVVAFVLFTVAPPQLPAFYYEAALS